MVLSAVFPSFSTALNPPPPLRRCPSFKTLALPSDLSVALIGGAAIAAAVSLTDPERRRQHQAQQIGGADKEVVRDYFNTTGFDRWNKIYGDSIEDVNKVQLDIRLGHSITVEKTIRILNNHGHISGITVCDAGCGTGSLSIPLARSGAIVSASDISSAMVSEARRRAEDAGVEVNFDVGDLEGLEGKYHTVVCLDVLIHYPKEKAEKMIEKLASLAERRLVLSFAPKTVYYSLLKRVGEMFPGASKATRAYLHAERDVEKALQRVGWFVRTKDFVSTSFYFSKIFEAVPAAEPQF